MGKKSEKKVKSDRINALRKQYDAFLEEDKKRKERNQYILRRLDNMRYNTPSIQDRHRTTHQGEVYPVYGFDYRSENLRRDDNQMNNPELYVSQPNQNHQLDIPRFHPDTELLKELSKKYILIPKLRPSLSNVMPTIVNDNVNMLPSQTFSAVSSPELNNDTDWKSKYDILEKIKQDEKQLSNEYEKDENYPVKDIPIVNNFKPNITSKDLKSTKYEHEIPEKDLLHDKPDKEHSLQHFSKLNISGSHDIEPLTNYVEEIAVMPIDLDTNTVIEYKDDLILKATNSLSEDLSGKYDEYGADQSGSEKHHMVSDDIKEDVTYDDADKIQQVQEPAIQGDNPVQYEQTEPFNESVLPSVPDSQTVYPIENEYAPIPLVVGSNELNRDNIHDPTVTESSVAEMNEYPIDVIDAQEFTPTDDVQLLDGVNVNPEGLVSSSETIPTYASNLEDENVIQHISEDLPDNAVVESLDTEQQEMFYPESLDQNDAYNQQSAEDGYHQEYAQNEQYPPTQEYAYYEGADHQEQAYPVEVNEHEETSQRYDQNYEEQYAANYEQSYEQQAYNPEDQVYDQGPQQAYEQPAEEYEQTQQPYQDYEYEQSYPEPIQNVEQVLDSEEGYIPQKELGVGAQQETVENQKSEQVAYHKVS